MKNFVNNIKLRQYDRGFNMRKKVVIIVPSKNFRDEEFNIPYNYLKSKNIEIIVASNEIGKAKGMNGSQIDIFVSIDELNYLEYDAVILVGGSGAEIFWYDKILHDFLKKANKNNAIIAASYKSPVSLAYAGILNNRKATVWIEDKDILDELGAYFTGASIQIDKNIITTDGPHSTKMFSKELLTLLENKKKKG